MSASSAYLNLEACAHHPKSSNIRNGREDVDRKHMVLLIAREHTSTNTKSSLTQFDKALQGSHIAQHIAFRQEYSLVQKLRRNNITSAKSSTVPSIPLGKSVAFLFVSHAVRLALKRKNHPAALKPIFKNDSIEKYFHNYNLSWKLKSCLSSRLLIPIFSRSRSFKSIRTRPVRKK